MPAIGGRPGLVTAGRQKMEAAYTYWRQNDPRFNREEAWPAVLFPDAKYRYFCDAGCLVCALAVMLLQYGMERAEEENRFDPWILNWKLISSGVFDSSADLELSYINRLYPLAYRGEVPYSPNALRLFMESGQPCLVTVPGEKAPLHFTVPCRMLSNDILLFDPLCGERKLNSYDRFCDIRLFQITGKPYAPSDSDFSRSAGQAAQAAIGGNTCVHANRQTDKHIEK